jgi:hypothetical protein
MEEVRTPAQFENSVGGYAHDEAKELFVGE